MEAQGRRLAVDPGGRARDVAEPPSEEDRQEEVEAALAALLLLGTRSTTRLRNDVSRAVREAARSEEGLAAAERRVASATTSGLDAARARAVLASRKAFEAQTGLSLPQSPKVVPGPFSTRQTGESIAGRWSTRATREQALEGGNVSEHYAAAARKSASDLERAAITETHQAYEAENSRLAREAARLGHSIVRVWNATLDLRTCATCEDLDGLEVDDGEEFPEGDPPLHNRCRCVVENRRT